MLIGVTPVEPQKQKVRWGFYLITGLGVLISVLAIGSIVYFWDEIERARTYGYIGGFLVSLLGGIAVIPAPSQIVTFTLGERLNPIYIGLLSGLGEALGGITNYLTGASAKTIWSRFRAANRPPEHSSGQPYKIVRAAESLSKGEALYDRLVRWVGGRGGSWVVFIASAMILSPSYIAGVAAGSVRMGLLRFFLLSWAGKTIRGLIIAFAGYGGLRFLLQWIGA